jgi:IS1 family transposase
MDELWSFVDHKGNKQWVWLALDVKSREIVGCSIGDRSQETAQRLWESLPGIYRQCAVVYTDHWEVYKCVLPRKRYCAVGKETGLTSYIERFNNTLRQRVSRLVRKTLSFSKNIENHVGTIVRFGISSIITTHSGKLKALAADILFLYILYKNGLPSFLEKSLHTYARRKRDTNSAYILGAVVIPSCA